MNKEVKFQPFGYNVLVEVPKIEEKTKGGILKSSKMLQEEMAKTSRYLEVFAVGSQVKEIKVGDKVLINGGNHLVITEGDDKYFLINQGLILGKEL